MTASGAQKPGQGFACRLGKAKHRFQFERNLDEYMGIPWKGKKQDGGWMVVGMCVGVDGVGGGEPAGLPHPGEERTAESSRGRGAGDLLRGGRGTESVIRDVGEAHISEKARLRPDGAQEEGGCGFVSGNVCLSSWDAVAVGRNVGGSILRRGGRECRVGGHIKECSFF